MTATAAEMISERALPVCLNLRIESHHRRLVSLLDIIELFDAFALSGSIILLESYHGVNSLIISEGGGGIPVDSGAVSKILDLFGSLSEKSRVNGFKDCLPAIEMAKLRLEQEHVDVSTLVAHLDSVRGAVLLALRNRKFLRVERERFQYVDHPELFGPKVNKVVPLASFDIKQAGNCLAADCSTAAVFHLMRVAEHGLRKLAKLVRVKLTRGGKTHPIEFADWDKVITAIKNDIAKARGMSPGPKRQSKLEAYSDAADHCLYMKEIWRNNISHTRMPYSDSEAVAVLERVRDFMKFMATKLVDAR